MPTLERVVLEASTCYELSRPRCADGIPVTIALSEEASVHFTVSWVEGRPREAPEWVTNVEVRARDGTALPGIDRSGPYRLGPGEHRLSLTGRVPGGVDL